VTSRSTRFAAELFVRRASPATAALVLLAARCVLEGLTFAAVLAVAQVVTAGDRSIPLVPSALALAGAGLFLATVLREARAARQNTAIAVGAMVAGAIFGVVQSPAHPDALIIFSRILVFAIVAEGFAWRALEVARVLIAWRAARDATLVAIGSVIVASILPGPIDRAALTTIGLAAIAAGGVALSVSRSAEELALAAGEGRGEAGGGTAPGTAIVLAAFAMAGAFLVPAATDALGRLGDAAWPALSRVLFVLLLPLGYVAAFLVEVFGALLRGMRFQGPSPPLQPLTPEEEAQAMRQIEAARPFVVGAVEVVIAIIALLFLAILVERMTRERRLALPAGVTLAREAADGDGLGGLIASLLPRRRRRPRAPRDDGTPAGALRALYWRFLARADAAGLGWRATGETPAEHLARVREREPRYGEAEVIVRAFERLRYAERAPDAETLAASRRALAAIDKPG